MKVRLGLALGMLMAVALAGAAEATVVGNWNGSNRSWNNSDMSALRGAVVAAGHTVRADAAITPAELAGDGVFVIGEATVTPSAGEMSDLSGFVNAGGILLVFTNSSASGVAGANSIFSALGSTLNFAGTNPVAAPFPAGPFTSGPTNIVGQTITTSPGNFISGGTVVAGSFVNYQQIGAGYVIAFGDRIDHNVFGPTAGTPNGDLFLNILQVAATPQVVVVRHVDVPTLSEWGLIGLAVLVTALAIGGLRRRKVS